MLNRAMLQALEQIEILKSALGLTKVVQVDIVRAVLGNVVRCSQKLYYTEITLDVDGCLYRPTRCVKTVV